MLKFGVFEMLLMAYLASKYGFKQAIGCELMLLALRLFVWLSAKWKEIPISAKAQAELDKDNAEFRRDLLPLSCMVATGIIIWKAPLIIHWVTTL